MVPEHSGTKFDRLMGSKKSCIIVSQLSESEQVGTNGFAFDASATVANANLNSNFPSPVLRPQPTKSSDNVNVSGTTALASGQRLYDGKRQETAACHSWETREASTTLGKPRLNV
jgi:hypothetical protein